MESTISNALIIFVRNTEKGKVKTRIARELGDEKTMAVYKHLLQYTAETAISFHCHRFVFYSDYVHLNDFFDDNCFTKFVQEGDELGERMFHAFEKVFALGHQHVCIIGSDCYQLQPTHIEEAFSILQHNDVAIGPTSDGGYYILGMNQPIRPVFENKVWGTSTVFDDTIDTLEQHQLKFKELEQLDDIDTLDDLLSTNILTELAIEIN